MRIALEIRHFMMGFSKSGKQYTLADMKIPFTLTDVKPKVDEEEVTPEEIKRRTEESKRNWELIKFLTTPPNERKS